MKTKPRYIVTYGDSHSSSDCHTWKDACDLMLALVRDGFTKISVRAA